MIAKTYKRRRWKAVREMWLVPIPKYVFFFPLVWEGRRWDESTGNYQERNDPTFLWLLNYNEYLEKRWVGQRIKI